MGRAAFRRALIEELRSLVEPMELDELAAALPGLLGRCRRSVVQSSRRPASSRVS